MRVPTLIRCELSFADCSLHCVAQRATIAPRVVSIGLCFRWLTRLLGKARSCSTLSLSSVRREHERTRSDRREQRLQNGLRFGTDPHDPIMSTVSGLVLPRPVDPDVALG